MMTKQLCPLAIAFIAIIMLPFTISAQTTKQEVFNDSINSLKSEIQKMQDELPIPPLKWTAYDKANNRYDYIEAYYEKDGDLVIRVKIRGEKRANLSISTVKADPGNEIAYVNGYRYYCYSSFLEDESMFGGFTLSPNVPKNYCFKLQLADYINSVNFLSNRMIDYFFFKEENSDSLLEFYRIPIRYDD